MGHPSAFEPNLSQPLHRQLQLVVHAGPLAGKGFPITGNALTIGRDADNDISLDDEQVSRHHARLIRQGDQVIIEDFGSTNGTLVNGKPIIGQHMLQPADIISIGASVFGVKGFSAPQTVGMTQLSMDPPPYLPPIQPPPSSPVPLPRPVAAPEPSKLTLVAIGGALALVATIVIVAILIIYFMVIGRNPVTPSLPTVVITAPVNGSQAQLKQPITVQAIGSDPAGVARMELWVSGAKISEAVSPTQGQSPLTASFQWTPEAPGSYTLEVRAYNTSGVMNAPAVVMIKVMGEPPSNTATPTPTPLPGTPTATKPAGPTLITRADLNVRGGPGTQYDLLGLLPTGATAEIIGRDEARQWWQIRFAPSATGVGWVVADPAFSQVFNVESIPILPAPPTPTGTFTLTPPPTNTPTATALPSTATPTPTPTPTSTPTLPSSSIQFDVIPASIEGGKCVMINWNITGVKEIYINDQGVGGTGQLEDCPKETKTYRLRVVKLDGSQHTQDKTVQVINPIVSSGSITIAPNQTVDFESGVIPGDDFMWRVDGAKRTFEVLPGVQLAPLPPLNSLDGVSLAGCANAAFEQYTFIDASDVILDQNNALVPGRSACYKTNQGRLGKLRFPESSTGSLKVEWLTWK